MRLHVKTFLFGISLIFTSCVTLYKPNAIHSPLLKEKGEFSASSSIGVFGTGLINLQAAYAIANNTGIMIDGMYHERRIISADSSLEKLNMFHGEAGAGYFKPFSNNMGLFQCYGGVGIGTTSDKIEHTTDPIPEVNAKYYNIFIQPGVGLINKNIEVAFDVRMNYVRLFNIHAFLTDKFEWWNSNFHYYSDTSFYFVNLEPALTVKVGGEKLKGLLQFGVTLPTINPDNYFNINTASVLLYPLLKFSFGISYTFRKSVGVTKKI